MKAFVTCVAALAFALSSAGTASAEVFNSASGLTIPADGNATPYPSTTSVSGTTGLITDINVGFSNLTHGDLEDIGAVLVSPTGQAFLVFDGIGGGNVTNINVAFDDQAAGLAPQVAPLPPGTYKPTQRFYDDIFPTPGPGMNYEQPGPFGGGTATLNGTFGGYPANGIWSLYVRDFNDFASGSIGLWSLSITTATPLAEISPTTHVFPVVDPAGPASSSRTFTVTNTGATPIQTDEATFAGDDPGDFSLTDDTCGSTLAPTATCTVDVAFDPDTAGSKSAQLRVQVDSVGTLSAEMSGTGGPIAELDDSTFAFGERETVAGPSATHSFVLSGLSSDRDVQIASVALTGADAGDFAVTSNPCNGVTVGLGETCEVQVAFDPASGGAKTATLRFATDAPTPNLDAQLTGTGLAPPPVDPGPGPGPGPGVVPPAATGQRAAALKKCKKKKKKSRKARKKCKRKAAKLPV
jgi:subtilisin-like proprotein convertase family protein